ncbi:hypothetical protein GCM10027294_43940 [Marinactinospora endophytica]
MYVTRPPQCRNLIAPEDFDYLVEALMKEHGHSREMSVRIAEQTLTFLRVAGTHPDQLSPSPLVDQGWHLFILNTRAYSKFCNLVAGRYIHHVPLTGQTTAEERAERRIRTTTAIREAGYDWDYLVWSQGIGGDCANCCKGEHEDHPPK